VPYDIVKRLAKIEDGIDQARALAEYLKATKGRTRAAKAEARAKIPTRRYVWRIEIFDSWNEDQDQEFWADSQEGPWDTKEEAELFARHEVGAEWRVVRSLETEKE
jgi:hypothetical protein